MNDHVGDDDLVLLYYGEEGHVGPQAATHVSGCAECAGRLAELRALLLAVEPPAAPERDADYGARVYARLLPRLQEPRKRSLPAVAGFLALAASLAFAFWLGRQFPEPDRALSADVRERILLVAVGDHLDRSQMVLVELANASADEPLDVRTQQASAGDLVSANRLYRQTAARSGDTALLAVLEELERLLVEVAAGPETLGRDDLAELQRRIESRGLLFKVRVVGSQVRAREKTPASPLRNVS
jgi:hypothetical protein